MDSKAKDQEYLAAENVFDLHQAMLGSLQKATASYDV
jgi:hypothetical protein